jgi:homogentisate 1,2-dioxygenase
MLTLHPCGFTHGPHPKAFAAGAAHSKTFSDEVALMLDARDALDVYPGLDGVELQNYVNSWKPGA